MMSDRYLLSRNKISLSVLKRLYGGRDCILDEERRNKKIEELRKRYKGNRLSREIPYTLDKAPIISEKRIQRLPKYLTEMHTKRELQRFVENLAELERIKKEYRPRREYKDAEEVKIAKARKKIWKKKKLDRKELGEYGEALDLDDTGMLREELEEAYIREEEKARKLEEKQEKKIEQFKKFYRRAATAVIKAIEPRETAKQRKETVDEVVDGLGDKTDIMLKYGGLIDKGRIKYNDILRIVYDELK